MREFGVVLLTLGICGTFYFAAMFDTSVETPATSFMDQTIGGDRVNNLGLMADRQNGIIISLGVAVIGTLMMLLSPKTSASAGDRKCPYCAELIKVDAKVCRFCNRDVIAHLQPPVGEPCSPPVPACAEEPVEEKPGKISDAVFWLVLAVIGAGLLVWWQSI